MGDKIRVLRITTHDSRVKDSIEDYHARTSPFCDCVSSWRICSLLPWRLCRSMC